MTLTLLLSALLQFLAGSGLSAGHLNGMSAPPDTSGVLTGSRSKPADRSNGATGQKSMRAKAMDTSGSITG